MSAPVTVLVAHDVPHVRQVWNNLLVAQRNRYHIKGEVATTGDLLQAVARLQPDVILMDAGMAGESVSTTMQQVHACAANAKLFICWRYCHEHLVRLIPGLPVAYLAEDVTLTEMLIAIRKLEQGNTYYCSQTERVLNPPRAVKALPKHYPQLLWCMRQGHTAEDMATATCLTLNTVRSYVRDIYARIGSRGMGALERFMQKEGLL
jgi:DNA-binding NarL/FixJ family response regulator